MVEGPKIEIKDVNYAISFLDNNNCARLLCYSSSGVGLDTFDPLRIRSDVVIACEKYVLATIAVRDCVIVVKSVEGRSQQGR